MASIFGHVIASTAIGKSFFRHRSTFGVLALAGFCAFAPDLDVIGMRLGIAYGSQWGHRGFTHSFVFAAVFGWLMAYTFYRTHPHVRSIALLLMISTATHPLLDMLTTGGLGCAVWWPFSAERHFFPIRPILVSPLSIQEFIGGWGLRVLASEALWVGLPSFALYLIARWIRA